MPHDLVRPSPPAPPPQASSTPLPGAEGGQLVGAGPGAQIKHMAGHATGQFSWRVGQTGVYVCGGVL